jgi:hypothetical protein
MAIGQHFMGIYRTPREFSIEYQIVSPFEGDTYITRYYLKRKVPLFVTD